MFYKLLEILNILYDNLYLTDDIDILPLRDVCKNTRLWVYNKIKYSDKISIISCNRYNSIYMPLFSNDSNYISYNDDIIILTTYNNNTYIYKISCKLNISCAISIMLNNNKYLDSTNLISFDEDSVAYNDKTLEYYNKRLFYYSHTYKFIYTNKHFINNNIKHIQISELYDNIPIKHMLIITNYTNINKISNDMCYKNKNAYVLKHVQI